MPVKRVNRPRQNKELLSAEALSASESTSAETRDSTDSVPGRWVLGGEVVGEAALEGR